ncbi:MAG: hypothetical protein U5M51_10145 [Emticicia sp.]|nr:hypothetical protein [Emticicia sp.]
MSNNKTQRDKEKSKVKSEQFQTADFKSINPKDYQLLLGKGMDVDWVKTGKGMEFYNSKIVKDFKNVGLSHVRIRIKA